MNKNKKRVSKSSYPPAAGETHVHVAVGDYVLGLRLPQLRLPRIYVRDAETHEEIERAL